MAQIIAKFVERLEYDRDSDKNAWLCNASCINIRQGQSFANASLLSKFLLLHLNV
jgi:hypothetical protein